jgi:hypothetical protein
MTAGKKNGGVQKFKINSKFVTNARGFGCLTGLSITWTPLHLAFF